MAWLSLVQESYATENFLGRLPVNFRSLTELSRDRGSLVEEPDLDEFVFCRVQNNVGLVGTNGRQLAHSLPAFRCCMELLVR